MKYFIAGIMLLSSQAVWSFQGFGEYQNLMEIMECIRKPGTDMVICRPKINDKEEEEVIPEPEPVIENPDLFPQEIISAPRATIPEMDYVWTDGSRFVIDLAILEDNLKFGEQCAKMKNEIYPEDINFDEHQDFMIQMECRTDELYEGKSIMDYWGGGYIAESFIIFACGSEEGLYNCTEEFTGHKDILAMAPDSWPGTSYEPAQLHDVNGDGVRDIFMWTNTDTEDRAQLWRADIVGDEPFFDRKYDLWGVPYEACEYLGNQPPTSCWANTSVQTYAISTPDGHVVKELEWPGKFLPGGGWEMYKTDTGELHLNLDTYLQGRGVWFTWNPDTEEFDYVVSRWDGEWPNGTEFLKKYRPIDITQDWNRADVFARGNWGHTRDWIKHNNVEYKVQERDLSKTVYDYNYLESYIDSECMSSTGFDYDICDGDQIYIVSKTDQGTETFIEYRPQEIATEVRYSRNVFWGYADAGHHPGDYNDYPSILIHGYWVTYRAEASVSGQIVQLEDRPDADWYFIVSYSAQTDMWAPGDHYVPRFNSELVNECRPGVECLYNESDIAFKYKIDFENQTLEYEGTLFEYPFIWRAIGAKDYEFRDANDDGWKDVAIKQGVFDLWHVSNIYGELQPLDLEIALPDGVDKEPSDMWMDFDSDGYDDYIQFNWNGRSTATFDVYKTRENLWDVTPTLAPWEIQDRVDNCPIYDDGTWRTLYGRAFRCYSLLWD